MHTDKYITNDTWIDIKGYEGLYQINQSGDVKSIPARVRGGKHGFRVKRERILHQWINNMGYPLVTLSKFGKQKKFTVHRLLATAFIPNPENKPIVNHINANTKDNQVSNLEWCDQSFNLRHAFKLGRKTSLGQTRKKVIDLCSGKEYPTSTEAAIANGFSKNHLSRMLRGLVKNLTCLQFAA